MSGSGPEIAAARAGTPATRLLHASGNYRFADRDLAGIAAERGDEAAWLAAFDRHGTDAPMHVTGDFSVAVRGSDDRTYLAVDRFAVRTLCYRIAGHDVHCHERADALVGPTATHDAQALFNYLYFHVIPAPRTAFADVHRVPAGHCVRIDRGSADTVRWWNPVFEEPREASFEEMRDEFRALLRGAVGRELAISPDSACFLSGGTDSSTVAGLVTEVSGAAAQTYSIGFDAEGYDEMAYARIAARHFRTRHHEYYVTPADLVTSIPAIAAACDQPFGNSSIVPTYYCAKLAREDGRQRILGGDGGDELFGGNSRYARQRVFDWYGSVPSLLRAALEPVLASRVATHLPLVRKAASYVEQARVPMPDRTQMYNLVARLGLADVLAPDFLAAVDITEPLRDLRECYDATPAGSLVNRMLAHDWRHTLAENDLPKVRNAAAVAGIGVGFPLLDDALVDFSMRLPPSWKLKRLTLRWFFKEALRGFLPDEILAKRKHGFGLPFGVWMARHPDLSALAFDSLQSLGRRGIVRESFMTKLIGEHLPRHPAYYGELVWIFMMLEQWLRRAPPRVTATRPRLVTTPL